MDVLTMTRPKCSPPKDKPVRYLDWHDWVVRMGRTHRQVRCREHGLYHNWIPKKRVAK